MATARLFKTNQQNKYNIPSLTIINKEKLNREIVNRSAQFALLSGSYQVAKISALLSLDFVCFCSKNSLYFSDPS
jgi:hypothetical protein